MSRRREVVAMMAAEAARRAPDVEQDGVIVTAFGLSALIYRRPSPVEDEASAEDRADQQWINEATDGIDFRTPA